MLIEVPIREDMQPRFFPAELTFDWFVEAEKSSEGRRERERKIDHGGEEDREVRKSCLLSDYSIRYVRVEGVLQEFSFHFLNSEAYNGTREVIT
jgi:hypothetical protein